PRHEGPRRAVADRDAPGRGAGVDRRGRDPDQGRRPPPVRARRDHLHRSRRRRTRRESILMADLQALRLGAEKVLTQATARLVEMQDRPLVATRKDLLDVVTDADLAAEKIMLDGLRALTPGAAILSEEYGASEGSTGQRWIIDPLDGTVNY